MNNEQDFLVIYGLQSFVSHAEMAGRSVFTIHASESWKMSRHAATLIDGTFGRAAVIHYT